MVRTIERQSFVFGCGFFLHKMNDIPLSSTMYSLPWMVFRQLSGIELFLSTSGDIQTNEL